MEKTTGKISKTTARTKRTKKAIKTRKEEEEQMKILMEYIFKKKKEMY
jgi:hypothetical protein